MSHFVPTDLIHRQIAIIGFYELELSRRIASIAASTGGLLVDVGANIGYFSAIWLSGNPSNKAVCFEPSPRNIDLMAKNLCARSLCERFQIEPVALGNWEGTTSFALGPSDQTGWGGFAHECHHSNVQVEVRTFDQYFRDSGAVIEVLKIDCEGADAWVIEGAKENLRKHMINHVFFENNETRASALGASIPNAIRLLEDCGYKIEFLTPGTVGEYHAFLP